MKPNLMPQLNPARMLTHKVPFLEPTLNLANKKILLIDDDPQICESLEKVLREEGYEVVLAGCGREGIEKFDLERIDLLLLDVSLPDMSGWEVFGTLMSNYPFVPTVMVTGKHNQQDLAVLSGVGALIEKPLNVPRLLETIAKMLCTQPIECRGEFGFLAGWRTLQRQYYSSHHILVADDDAEVRRLSARVLIRAGYRVDTVEDGAAAWHALKLNNYDLLITDNDMPNLSGVELIEHLVIDHLLLPVILVSGTMPMGELRRLSRLRIEGVLLKPYDVPEFLGKVESILGKLTKPTSCLAWGTSE